MARLVFDCVGAYAEPYATAPTVMFKLRVSEVSGERIHAIALTCQLRIEPKRRRYSPSETERLHDLFGDTARWADTLKPIQLANVAVMVPGFTGATAVDVPVVCTYDIEVASARYFAGLDDGEVPLLLLFSGTVFVQRDNGFQVERVPWSAETVYRLPIVVWREIVDRYFPNSGWIRCSQDTLDALARFKAEQALPTWDSTLTALLARALTPEGGVP
jgi:hypothetical protein